MKWTKEEARLWAEAVRLHYMSLEGAGPGAMEEAGFFLIWHWDNAENRKKFVS